MGAEGGQAAYMFVAPLQELSMDDACGPEVSLIWLLIGYLLCSFCDTSEATVAVVLGGGID